MLMPGGGGGGGGGGGDGWIGWLGMPSFIMIVNSTVAKVFACVVECIMLLEVHVWYGNSVVYRP